MIKVRAITEFVNIIIYACRYINKAHADTHENLHKPKILNIPWELLS